MIWLYLTNIALASLCIWLVARAHRADVQAKIANHLRDHAQTIARIAKEDADATFELWCQASRDRDRQKEIVKWLQLGEQARQRRMGLAHSPYLAPMIVMPVTVLGE